MKTSTQRLITDVTNGTVEGLTAWAECGKIMVEYKQEVQIC